MCLRGGQSQMLNRRVSIGHPSNMKLVYVTLLLVLVASLMVLEILASRLPAESMMPARVGGPRAMPASSGG